MTRNIKSKTMMIFYLPTASSMGDDRRWMYDGWKRSGAHTQMCGGIRPKILSSVYSLS
jgi:hypothetical protein